MPVNPLGIDDAWPTRVPPPRGAGGPQIFSPQGSNIGTGKEVGPWTNPSTDAGTPSPQMMEELAKARGLSLPAFLRSNPIAAFLYSTLYSTPAETGELPLSLSGARPEHPHSTGAMPSPPIQPQHPSTMRYPMWPTPPSGAAPTMTTGVFNNPVDRLLPPRPAAAPAARPKVDPAAVDLGYYRPSVGNARTPTWVPPGQTQAPDIFRGLLAQRPT